MKRQLSEEMQWDFFFVHDSIVYGVLKKLNIPYTHPDYDDFVQIGLLKLVEAYETFPKDLNNEEHFYQFTGYAFQKIRWAMLDELRKQNRKFERETRLPEEFDIWVSDDSAQKNEWETWELFQTMLEGLDTNEKSYMMDSVINQLTVTAIAKKYGVSRKTVYGWKKRAAKKLEQFRSVLKN